MRIQTKLSLNAMVATACLTVVGALGFFYILDVAKLSHKLVEEQAKPIVLINELEKTTWEIWSRYIVHTSTSDFEVMQSLEQELQQLIVKEKRQIESIINIYQSNATLPPALLHFQENWQRFQEKAAKVLLMSQEFTKVDAQDLLLGAGQKRFNSALNNLREQVDLHRQQMDILRKEASTTRQEAGWTMTMITIIVGTFMLILLFYIGRSISYPLKTALKTANQIAKGDLTARATLHTKRDEIAILLTAMNNMAERLQLTITELSKVFKHFSQGNMNARIKTDFIGDFAQIKSATNEMAENLQALISETRQAFGQLANGNMAVRIEHEFPGDFAAIKQASNEMAEELQGVISETSRVLEHLSQGNMKVNVEREFAGDFGEIRNALLNTSSKLGQATLENNQQTWLKSGQAQLNDAISGEQNLIHLAENIINFLVPYLNAQVGAIYLLSKDDEKDPMLKMLASHAYVWRKTADHVFRLGEGIVGQAGLERKLFVITHAPEDYIDIRSGLGESTAKEILVAPFLYEDQLKGVLEIASFEHFTEIELEFLKQILPIIAVAINTTESRTQMQELLDKTQIQAEQLQKQTTKMEQQQTNLREANEELQSQTEELMTQQEELRQSNEELEQRTNELERQKSEIRKQNQELEKARTAIQTKAEELELASKYKSEFLSNMSHELRTPLNSLLILAQILANNKEGNLTEKQIECAHTIHSSGGDLLTLINEILDLSKIEAGRVELHPERLDIAELITSFEQKFRHVAENKALSFEILQSDNLPMKMVTDSQRLHQVINNLLSNAFKFTQQGGVTLEIRRPTTSDDLSGTELNPVQTIAISVTDTGIGIPLSKQKVIFEPFQQADGSTSRKFGGTGLGLSIARQLVELMGGIFHLYSKENEGACFTVYLPEEMSRSLSITTTHDVSIEIDDEPEIFQTPTLPESAVIEDEVVVTHDIADDRENLEEGDKALLIIEDDPTFAKTLLELARERGFKCLVALDGGEGLQLAEKKQPSAVVLDVALPQVDGWTVMERIKLNPNTRHIPVHFVSGSDRQKEARLMGAIGYSLKPVSMTDMGEAFNKIEYFINKSTKHLLVVTNDEQHREDIAQIVSNNDIHIIYAVSSEDAIQHLRQEEYDSLIVHISNKELIGFEFLETLSKDKQLAQIPTILYTTERLNEIEENRLQELTGRIIAKTVHSLERLLDEVTLFLHQVEAHLPQNQQRILRNIYDKESIFRGKYVLLVDDDMRNVFALTTILEQKDMETIVAINGREALHELENNQHVDIILMDIMMPEMDGYEAMREIRKQAKFYKLPIIALTAKAMKGDRAKCIEAGASDYLTKPIDADKLLSLMRVWLYQ